MRERLILLRVSVRERKRESEKRVVNAIDGQIRFRQRLGGAGDQITHTACRRRERRTHECRV